MDKRLVFHTVGPPKVRRTYSGVVTDHDADTTIGSLAASLVSQSGFSGGYEILTREGDPVDAQTRLGAVPEAEYVLSPELTPSAA